MGVAIIVPDVNFSDCNLGKVTMTDDVPVRALSIIGNDSISGTSYKYNISLYPLNTNQRDVRWSVASGQEYASIDNNGNLTVKSGASNSDVTIMVVSKANTEVIAVKNIKVTYVAGNIEELEYIESSGYNYALLDVTPRASQTYEIKTYFPAESVGKPVAWLGSRIGDTSQIFNLQYNRTLNKITLSDSPSSTSGIVETQTVSAGIFVLKTKKVSPYLEVTKDGASFGTSVMSSASTAFGDHGAISDVPLCLWQNNVNGVIGSTVDRGASRIYYIKVFDNGQMTREIKPVLMGGKPCFRDSITGSVYNIIGESAIKYKKVSGEIVNYQ